MVDPNTILLYLVLGPIGLLLTFLEYGFPFGIENAAEPLTLYIVSMVGTSLWASIVGAFGQLLD